MNTIDQLKQLLLDAGVQRIAAARPQDIVYDPIFRDMCAKNSCGRYGTCYMCPPDVGDIHQLIEEAKGYALGLMYQNVYEIEDSFDFEGMMDARKTHSLCAQRVQSKLREAFPEGVLHLAVGGCGVCERCAKMDQLPCRFPEQAVPSLESYGVDVYHTAENVGLKYVNGQNTITYFGMLLLKEDDHA